MPPGRELTPQYNDGGLLTDRPALPTDAFSRAALGEFATYEASVGDRSPPVASPIAQTT